MSGKIVVALVSTRDCHHGTSAVRSQDVISDPNRNFLSCERMQSISPREGTRDIFNIGLAIAFCLECRLLLVSGYFILLICRADLSDKRVLRRQDHKAHAKNGIGARRKYFDLQFGILDSKMNTCSFRFTNPVALLFFECVGPVNAV